MNARYRLTGQYEKKTKIMGVHVEKSGDLHNVRLSAVATDADANVIIVHPVYAV